MSGLRDFGSIPKEKSESIEEYYYSGTVSAAPSAAMVNTADKGYGR